MDNADIIGVQFKLDGYVLEALDTTAPFEIVWSAASATEGIHTITAEARYASGEVGESAPLSVSVDNAPTSTRTLYVDAANGDDSFDGLTPGTAWRTLGRANGAVQPGDAVLLKGTFSGQTINPASSGTADSPITFASAPGQTGILSGGYSAVSLIGRSYITFEGLRIQDPSYEAFYLESSHHIAVRNSTMINIGTAYGSWGHAFEFTQSSDNLIEGNTVINVGNRDSNSGDSVWLKSASNRNRFLRNVLTDGGHSLFQVSSQQSTAPVADTVIARNILSNSYTTPVILAGDVGGAERTLIEYNRISDAGLGSTAGVYGPRPGIQIQARENVIRYNEIFNNAGPGISLNAYVFTWSGGDLLQESIGNQIYHNVFYGNNRVDQLDYPLGSLHITNKNGLNVRDNFIANNIFYGNRGGIFSGTYYTITVDQYHNDCNVWPAGSLNGNRIENNIFLRDGGAPGEVMTYFIRSACGGGNVFYTLAELQSTFGAVRNNIEVNPLFVNEATRDFHLLPGSPAIDVGVVIPGVPFNGTAPDLGVYETDSGTPPVQSPFLGSPFAMPGTIQAEDFDHGGEGIAYHDNVPGNAGGFYRGGESVDIVSDGGTGYKVNNFETGEWMEYTISVAVTGRYRVSVQAASAFENSAFHIEIDDVDVTGTVPVPNTGAWNTFQDVRVSDISISAGQHVLRLVSDQQYSDVTSIQITAEPPGRGGFPWAIPIWAWAAGAVVVVASLVILFSRRRRRR